MPKGIRRADMRDRWEWQPQEVRPTYKTRERVDPQVNEWALQWGRWINKVLLPELHQAIDEFDDKEKRCRQAMEQIQFIGATMHEAGCLLLNMLNSTYPDSRARTKSDGQAGPVTDSTKPPPPPFGGGL
jgi:hypothetical protein